MDEDPYWGHVLYPQFGSKVNSLEWLLELADKLHGKKVNGYDLDIIVKETYIDQFNIANLDDPRRPMALVAMHPKETVGEGDHLLERIDQFKIYEIHKHYGCTLSEFLEYPRHVVEHILTTLRDEHKRIASLRAKAKADAERGNLKQTTDVDGVIIPPLGRG